jgi:hypothetical protein
MPEMIINNENKLNDDNNQLSAEQMYTSISVAKDEIWRRWNDKELKIKVEKFLGHKIPEVFNDEPMAILFRHMATPNFESKRFLDLAKMMNLNPAYLEFSSDKFCTRNKDKICLGKMCFCSDEEKTHTTYRKIIDLKANDNKPFNEIDTLWGVKLTEFHHELFNKYYGANSLDFFDVSYLKNESRNVNELYDKFLALFVCFGVLFENFIFKDGHYEKSFTNDVVYPAFKKNIERFGVNPIIVPLLPISDEDGESWMWYANELEKEIKL